MMNLKMCKKCLMLSTRPRLTFDEHGVCSACQWAEEKRTVVDWKAREAELRRYCDRYRSRDGNFDCIVPVSGGKDSSMVAHKLKHRYHMHPLCININHSPRVNTPLNEINLTNFIEQGFDCMRIYPNPKVLQILDRKGLVDYGQPYFGWMTAMVLAPLKIATQLNIPFIMYGEEGEVEYGGSVALKNTPVYTVDDTVRYYLSGIHPEIYREILTDKELYWHLPPSEEAVRRLAPAVAHWSYFENWNSNENFRYARDHVGLQVQETNSPGTYNAFAQTDGILYPLHTYFMFLKFGFGRCTQDVCIDIRSGELTREAGLPLVEQYDEVYPEQFEEQYLDYYQMSRDEFYAVIDRFANRELLHKVDGRWRKKFSYADLF